MRSWWRLTWGLMVASGLAAQSISRAEVLDQNAAGFTLQQQIVVPVS